ncbi:MAG: hydrogenase maturation nickel metallochaperone HypA [Desulfobacteraceae bacterium]|jgi:hydrogenase nickel incorporation protein HypA/HybF
MHEMGIATEIVRIVVESIPDDMTDPKVERINLKVGKLAAVVSQSLQFCFEVAAKETPAEGADLHIEEIAVSASCRTCGHRWQIDDPVFRCPECDSGSIEMLTGRELDIESIELAGE